MTTYSAIGGLALIGTGEESGTWGTVTNLNLRAIERGGHGFKTIDLVGEGTTYNLTTNDITQPSDLDQNGHYAGLRFINASANTTIVIKSNNATTEFTQTKVYLVMNSTSHDLIFDQNDVASRITISAGKSKIIFAAGGTLFDMSDTLEMDNAQINGGTLISNDVQIGGGTITNITDLAVADGGTGASDAAGARTNLGVTIGSEVQAWDAGLDSISGLTTDADKMIYTTAADTYAVTGLSQIGRDILDDADGDAVFTTLGVNATAAQVGLAGRLDVTALGTSEAEKVVTADASNNVVVGGTFKPLVHHETSSTVSVTANVNIYVDCSAGNLFELTLTWGGVNTKNLVFQNAPASGTAYACTLKVTQDPSNPKALSWDPSVKWGFGVPPSISSSSNAIDIFTFFTLDGGTNWYGFVAGQEMA
jgi:hypothetical protein